MADTEDSSTSYSIDEKHARSLIRHANEQIDIIADLLSEKTQEKLLDLKVIALLCDSFSSNYHIWRILNTNLNYNIVEDKKGNKKVVAMSEQDLFLTESAILAKTFTTVELLKLNYSLSLH